MFKSIVVLTALACVAAAANPSWQFSQFLTLTEMNANPSLSIYSKTECGGSKVDKPCNGGCIPFDESQSFENHGKFSLDVYADGGCKQLLAKIPIDKHICGMIKPGSPIKGISCKST